MAEHLEEKETSPEATELPFGVMREESPFTITLKGNLVFEFGGAERTVKTILEIEDAIGSPFSSDAMPFSYFASPQLLGTFLAALKGNFFELMKQSLSEQLALDLALASGFVAHALELDTNGKEEIIEHHVQKTRERLKQLLSPLPDKARRAVWTRPKLEQAARAAALNVYTSGDKLTLEAVADEIRKHYGANAPASGEALRKQLERFQIDWMKIKTDTKRFAKIRF